MKSTSTLNCNKGTIMDIIFLLLFAVVFTTGMIITLSIFSKVKTSLNESEVISNESVNTFSRVVDRYPSWDYLILFGMVIISVAGVLSAIAVKSHPAFFFVFLILLVFLVIISAIFSNMYADIVNNPQLEDAANQFPIGLYVMRYLPFFVGILGFGIIIAMYAKGQ